MLKYLLQKEFLQIRRNPFLPKLIFVFPIVIMCVMPWVMNQEVKNIRVCVVDNDRSTMSQRLVHSIEQSNYFIFSGQQPSYDAALKEIEKSRTDIVLVIPPNFSRDLTLSNGGGSTSPTVLIAANAVNGTKGGIGSSYLSQIVTANVNPEIATIQSKVSTLFLYNKHLNYKVFMIPALLAIVMMLMCGFLPALNIVGEKETGTI
ncbi:MAG: ABC transporter permease, partial [Prevotella sp.]|nr:ABC transporter permease [Prevotella sp.]